MYVCFWPTLIPNFACLALSNVTIKLKAKGYIYIYNHHVILQYTKITLTKVAYFLKSITRQFY